jgi:hypothetical protein
MFIFDDISGLMISKHQQLATIAVMVAVATVGIIAAVSIPQIVNAAQSCNQPGGVVAACVNANVAKNNICVGVISRSDRCTQ